MKRILCFGDSNTYGLAFSPEKGPYRLDEEHRWTCLLQKELGPEYRIIEEGLNGRTTAFDVPASDTPPLFDAPNFASRNGAAFLPMCLESHSPLDLVILNLGTNDSTKLFGLGTPDIGLQFGHLVVELLAHAGGDRPRKAAGHGLPHAQDPHHRSRPPEPARHEGRHDDG